jgi:hypothetical protein
MFFTSEQAEFLEGEAISLFINGTDLIPGASVSSSDSQFNLTLDPFVLSQSSSGTYPV